MSHRTARALALCVFAALGAGCADPRQAQVSSALDVAGTWREVDGPGVVIITNIGSINDVLVEMEGRAVDAAEAAAIDRVVDPSIAEGLRTRLVLGSAPALARVEVDGGENVSFDGGVRTSIAVVGDPIDLTPSPGALAPSSLRFALSVTGDTARLVGTLAWTSAEVLARPDDITGGHLAASRAERAVALVPE